MGGSTPAAVAYPSKAIRQMPRPDKATGIPVGARSRAKGFTGNAPSRASALLHGARPPPLRVPEQSHPPDAAARQGDRNTCRSALAREGFTGTPHRAQARSYTGRDHRRFAYPSKAIRLMPQPDKATGIPVGARSRAKASLGTPHRAQARSYTGRDHRRFDCPSKAIRLMPQPDEATGIPVGARSRAKASPGRPIARKRAPTRVWCRRLQSAPVHPRASSRRLLAAEPHVRKMQRLGIAQRASQGGLIRRAHDDVRVIA